MVNRPVVVASHPRSGTHLLIDMLRNNFPALRKRVGILSSERELYFDLDLNYINSSSDEVSALLKLESFKRPIVKTHLALLGQSERSRSDLVQKVISASTILYVFRDPARVMESYRQMMAPMANLQDFLSSPRAGFDVEQSTLDVWRNHADVWRSRGAHFVDSTDLLQRPGLVLDSIAKVIGESRILTKNPIPNIRKGGKVGQLFQRLQGRKSTAVVVANKRVLLTAEERSRVLSENADVIARLREFADEFLEV